MGYPELVDYSFALNPKSSNFATAANLASAPAQWQGYMVMHPISIKRGLFFVTTQVAAATTAPQVAIKQRPTYGSASGAVTLCSLTIPTGSLVGQCIYKDVSDKVQVAVGQEVSFETTVQAADPGTAAGAGFIGAIWEVSPDADANQANLVKSV